MPLLKNKIAVVTGGGSGIGLATAKRFVEEGAYVFIAGRRQEELDKAVTEIGQNVTGVKTDISKLDDLDHLYETVAKKGKIDVIFANAAFVEKRVTTAVTPEHFEKTFNTNARGTYFTIQKALPHLNDGASIILVASAGKNMGLPAEAPTAGPKRRFGRSLAHGPTNSRIERSGPTCLVRVRLTRRCLTGSSRPRKALRGQKADDCNDPSGTFGRAPRRLPPQLCSLHQIRAATSPGLTCRSMAA